MDKKHYFTRDNVIAVKIPEEWRKLKNFQVVPPLTLEQQINRFQAAGRKMEELAGLGVYDFADSQPLDDELEDITRDPDFDQIDAAVAARDAFLRAQTAAASEQEKPVPSSEPVESVSEKTEKVPTAEDGKES